MRTHTHDAVALSGLQILPSVVIRALDTGTLGAWWIYLLILILYRNNAKWVRAYGVCYPRKKTAVHIPLEMRTNHVRNAHDIGLTYTVSNWMPAGLGYTVKRSLCAECR